MKYIQLGILLFFVNVSANATLVQWDAFTAGDQLAVKDLDTGIIWLDLTESDDVGYFQAGDLYEDWGYATNTQVEDLLEKAFPSYATSTPLLYQNDCLSGQTCFGEAQQWLDLFGSTLNNDSALVGYGFGLYQDEDDIVRLGGARINANPAFNNAFIYGDEFTVDYDYYQNTAPVYYYSTFLTFQPAANVNNAIPEPSTLGLFASMVLLMMFRRKVNFR